MLWLPVIPVKEPAGTLEGARGVHVKIDSRMQWRCNAAP
jgi:hypothetical protein